MEAHGTIPDVVEWATAATAIPGELASGDLAVVVSRRGGALLAVIDALGHGPEAADAARIAQAALVADPDAPLLELFRRADEALLGHRGVVMTLAIVGQDGAVSWAGIGDVEAAVIGRDRTSLALRGGSLGDGSARPRAASVALAPGDLLVMATDGVQATFSDDVVPNVGVMTNAAVVLQRRATGRDDALVLIARFVGTQVGPQLGRTSSDHEASERRGASE